METNGLQTAIRALGKRYGVIPDGYCIYNGAYLFRAFEKGLSENDKRQTLDPFYLVDIRKNIVGQFSPVFDMSGFQKAMKEFKKL